MNEDIKILREALAAYREFVDTPKGQELRVPMYLCKEAREGWASACAPDRIARLLDEIEGCRIDLRAARAIFGMVYDAVEKGRPDEALLHCGAGEAMIANSLEEP